MGQYVPGHSFLHRLDPRAKLLITLMLVLSLFFVERVELLLAVGGIIFAVGCASGIGSAYLLRGLRLVWILALFTLVFNALFTPGQELVRVVRWSITLEGLVRGCAMAGRFFLMVLITSLLTLTTSPIMLTDAIERLLSPFKRLGVPAHELAMVSTIALRFVPTLAQEAENIMKAQLARGACFDRGAYWKRIRALVAVLVPLFVSAFRYAEDLAVAMEARCYRGGEGRTSRHEMQFSNRDVWALISSLLLAIVVVWGEHYLG